MFYYTGIYQKYLGMAEKISGIGGDECLKYKDIPDNGTLVLASQLSFTPSTEESQAVGSGWECAHCTGSSVAQKAL